MLSMGFGLSTLALQVDWTLLLSSCADFPEYSVQSFPSQLFIHSFYNYMYSMIHFTTI